MKSKVKPDPDPTWETVEIAGDRATWRLAVPGGWIYRKRSDPYSQVAVFVPDLRLPRA